MMCQKPHSYLFFLVLWLCCCTVGTAQENERTGLIFGQVGIEAGNYAGFTLAGNYVFENKFSIQLGYQALLSAAAEKPQDFQLGFFDLLAFGTTSPVDTYNVFHASVGRIIALNAHPKTRVHILGGIGFTWYNFSTNFQSSGGSPVVANYSFDVRDDALVFFLIQPRVEFCLSPNNGISVGPVVKISERENLFGFAVNYIFGRLRTPSKP